MMHRLLLVASVIALIGAATPVPAAELPAPGDLVAASITAEDAAVAPGTTLWTAIRLKVKQGWHIYWRNPGDAGLPTGIAWHLPTGFSAGAVEWPVPERFQTGALANYGYTGTTDLLVPITAPSTLDPGAKVPLNATVSWLVCSEICIPGEARLALDLPVGAASPDPATVALFSAARTRLPRPARFDVRVADAGRDYRLFVPRAALAGLDKPSAEFFPYDGNAIDQGAAQRVVPAADGLTLVIAKPGKSAAAPRQSLSGVLQVKSGGESRAFIINAMPAPAPAGLAASDDPSVWQAVLLALVGGLILNLMPCVFPILSLKVLSLTTLAHRGDGLRVGLAYGAGAVLSFAALGGLLLGLRETGAAVGWGFQLQSPVVVGLLAYLLFAMGLSLSGVAEFGAGLAGMGHRLAGHAGLAGAFGTGVLATVVATPCTAPFMGTALGFALVAPTSLAFSVFVALGVGLAAPFMLIAAWPGVARLLPRPGPWMVWVKQILAFPLYGTVAWLMWVLGQEVAPGDALTALFGLVAVAFAIWIYGRTRFAAAAGRRWGTGLAALGLAAAIGLAAMVSPGAPGPAAAASDGLPYQPFTVARLAALRAEKKPVFVNLTAAWCVTCLFNERATLDLPAVRHEFAAHGIVALKGDWTRRNPDITAFLQRHGRSGVPLYLLYDGRGGATVLPQILTETAVLNAVAKI